MGIDRTTKFLLTLIALGLFLNAMNPWLLPKEVSAQSDSYVISIERNLGQIAKGTCPNQKICQ